MLGVQTGREEAGAALPGGRGEAWSPGSVARSGSSCKMLGLHNTFVTERQPGNSGRTEESSLFSKLPAASCVGAPAPSLPL